MSDEDVWNGPKPERLDMGRRRALVAVWGRFLGTRPGAWVKEHTKLVHRLGGNDDKSVRSLTCTVFVLSSPLLVVALFTWSWIGFTLYLLLLAFLGGCAGVFWRSYRGSVQQDQDRFDTNPYLMQRPEVEQRLSGWALSRDADHALPGTRAGLDEDPRTRGMAISPRLAGVPLGRCHDVSVWTSTEQGVYVLASSRTGKTTRIIIPYIMEAPGAVITTSSRSDVVEATLRLRRDGYSIPSRDGDPGYTYGPRPVYIFDPTGILPEDSEFARYRINWNPVRSCTDLSMASHLASALVGAVGLTGENQVWAQSGVQIVQSLLLAGAIKGLGLDGVYSWARDESGPNAALRILQESDREDYRDWARPLQSLVDMDARTRSNMMLSVSNAFDALALPSVRDRLSPSPGRPEFDMREFIESRGVVYVLAPLRSTQGGAEAPTGVFGNMFLAEARDVARSIAFSSSTMKLEPSLSMVLDEVVNITPWEGIPQLFTAGSGDGIQVLIVAQSRAQARAGFGEGEEKQMWDNAQKVIGSGQASQEILNEISELSGEHEARHDEHSWSSMPMNPGAQGPLGGISTMERVETKPALTAADIRRIPLDRCLLLTGNLRPAAVTLIPYWERCWYQASTTGTPFKPESAII